MSDVSEAGKERDLFEADEEVLEGDGEKLDLEVIEKLLVEPLLAGAHLREAMTRELERRNGEWEPFVAQVDRRIDDAARASDRMSVEDRAIASYRDRVASEVALMEPRFERAFKEGIEQQIWRAAKEKPSLFDRARSFLRKHRAQSTWSLGLATATAAIIALFFLSGLFQGHPDTVAAFDSSGVSIDQVSFEGTVTVMPADNGMTVVWLASDESS
jgi:hypothetical protein